MSARKYTLNLKDLTDIPEFTMNGIWLITTSLITVAGQLRSRSRGHLDQRDGGQAQERHRHPGRL